MNTILKWAGNKTAIMPELIKHLPAGQRLVEPFAGSCAVMMATDYPAYLVADINPDLINLYRTVQEACGWVIDAAQALFAGPNSAERYYAIREVFNHDSTLTPRWRAAYFIYLNRHGYRGLCRYNRRGHFNVPYGNYQSPYFPGQEILAFAEKARRATFVCAGYAETLAMLCGRDVVYCDPPYDGTFSSYYSNGFDGDEQCRLAGLLASRVAEGYTVVVSNSDTPLIRSLYRHFTCYRVLAPRCMGYRPDTLRQATEIIAVSVPPHWAGSEPPAGQECYPRTVIWR